jgi:predicted acetyltransferase
VEYDLVGTTRHTIAHELLYAHYWNQYHLYVDEIKGAISLKLNLFEIFFIRKKKQRKVGKQQMKSVFVLPDRTLQKLEKKWVEQIRREHPSEDLTFSQWVGLDVASTA